MARLDTGLRAGPVTRLASLLGVVATTAVTVSGAVVVGVGLTRPGPGPASTTATPQAVWQRLESSYGALSVPPTEQGWTVPDPGGLLFYVDDQGARVAGVRGPAVLDDGYCSSGPAGAPSNRAFVGITPPRAGTTLREADRHLVRSWITGIGGDPGRSSRTVVRLADGTRAVTSRTTIRLRDRDPCTPPRAEVHLVSTRSARGVVSAVLVRDLGPGAAGDDVVRRILRSLRVDRR